jgi:hypothetical protein
MFYIVFVILLFIFSVMVHIFFCRTTSKPGLHAKAFVFIAVIFLCIYGAGVALLQNLGILDPRSVWGLPFKITAGIIFVLLVPIYLCFYVLTQLTSPSKRILLSISQRGELSHNDILASVKKEDFITSRLNDLCTSKCVKEVDGRYSLTSEGRKIALVLNMMQNVLGRDVGG